MQPLIFDIKRYAIHDGPGIRTTVYLKGCPLSCAWCHNPEGQSALPEIIFWEQRCIHCNACRQVCPQDADLFSTACTRCGQCVLVCPAKAREMIGRPMSVQEVVDEIERDTIFYDQSGGGVTFSGGEPLAQPDFLGALLLACQEHEIHTAVDTSGFAPAETVRRLSPAVDLFLYDLKLMDDQAHRHYTGVSNQRILDNLALLVDLDKPVIVRIPIVPGITDGKENISALGHYIAELAGIQQVDILPYHRAGSDKYGRLQLGYSLAKVQPPTTEQMTVIASRLKAMGLNVTIGG